MSSDTPKTFFKLDNNQRKSPNAQLHSLNVNGNVCETDEDIREGWATHFQKLATPLESECFDEDYKELVDLDVSAITEDRPVFP